MSTRWVLSLAGVVLFLAAACSSRESVVVVPADELGTLQGSVKIGPICPVEPCSTGIGDTYSSRQLQLTSDESEDVMIHLNQDGTFNTLVPIGRYQVNLSDCIYLGCSSAWPVAIEIVPREAFELRIDVDTGIRSAVPPRIWETN